MWETVPSRPTLGFDRVLALMIELFFPLSPVALPAQTFKNFVRRVFVARRRRGLGSSALRAGLLGTDTILCLHFEFIMIAG